MKRLIVDAAMRAAIGAHGDLRRRHRLVEIERIEKALERWGERFARILGAAELERFAAHRQPAAYLAKRFAAKEAFTKALGTGIQAPANWHGVWVVNQASGKPVARVRAAARGAAGRDAEFAAHICPSPTSAAWRQPP